MSPGAGDLINAILADHGLPPADVFGADGSLHGYVVQEPSSARGAIEPIADLFGLVALEGPGGLAFRNVGGQSAPPIQVADMVFDGRQAIVERVRTPDHQLPTQASLSFRDPLADYQTISVSQIRYGAPGNRQNGIGISGVMEAGQGKALLNDWLQRVWSERETVGFGIAAPNPDIVPGAIVRLPEAYGPSDYLVTEIEDGLIRHVQARQIVRSAPTPWGSSLSDIVPKPVFGDGQPLALFLDLPAQASSDTLEDRFLVAAWRTPWKSQTVFASPETTGYELRSTLGQPADIGVLREPLAAGVIGRFDKAASMVVELFSGELASRSRGQVLNGANRLAVGSNSGVWELIQFQTAVETEPNVWTLRGLLRAQLGTDDAMGSGAPVEAYVVILDEAVRPAGLNAGEAGLALNWRVGSSGAEFSDANFVTKAEIGGVRALLPLSPVRLSAKGVAGGQMLSWIRRGRVDADSWLASEIPLGEDREEYQLEIAHAGGGIVRTVIVLQSDWLYETASIIADFGAPPAEIDVTVRQRSLVAGLGVSAKRRLTLV